IADGQGLCQACNLAKQAPGWDHQPTIDPDTGHTVRVTTPTGRHYRSTAPPILGPRLLRPEPALPQPAVRQARQWVSDPLAGGTAGESPDGRLERVPNDPSEILVA
ncbi:MAG: hypothetical protein FWD74_08935, partial [Actinomycetia bacterium]|nr:hypothetical protein [Actinomycetes bacterium]